MTPAQRLYPRRRHAPPAAFTLVELMIVIVMLSIVALLVMPTARDDATRVRLAAALLVADLDYAQLQSLGHGVDPCVFVFDVAENRYHLARETTRDQPLSDPASGGHYLTRFGEGRAQGFAGVTLQEVSVGDDEQLRFTAMGALDHDEAATITLACGSSTVTIHVDADTGDATVH